jgi:regulation of enolase protein 1 (concanavalin A-like superfamily)
MLVTLAAARGPRQAAAQSADQVGQWSAVQNWPIVSVHTVVLPTGKVMFYPYSDDPRLWDPANSSITTLPKAGYNIFCTGHSHISDGRILITGGHIENNRGLNDASYYNPFTNAWTRLADMNDGRWYPTNTVLGNGDVLVTSGDKSGGGVNDLPQVWQVGSSSWRNLTSAVLSLPLYPASFLAGDGRVFFATSPSRYLNTSGTGSWSSLGNRLVGGRDNYGSAAMYDVGKVIYTGGADPPVSSAEIIDLNAPTPAWSYTGAMPQARRQHNVTILPDGKLLVTGGSASSGFNTVDGGKAAYMWDPATGSWTTMASESRYRGYHSTAVLLPDGRVLSSGGDGEPNAQVYSPPYLFKGARPTISGAPTSVSYGQTFTVNTPEASSITNVNWVRLSSVTHTKNMDQRINRLSFTRGSGLLNVTAPSSTNLCPPGYYMLFILNGTGVPSVSRIIRISGSSNLPSPWVNQDVGAVATTGSATHSSGTFTVAGSGADIWNGADEFHFVHQPGSGDCSVTARVGSLQNTNAWAKAGVMIREGTGANAKHAMMVVTPGNGLAFQYRNSTGGTSTHVSGGSGAAPYWVRITRTGSTFIGYKSTDGSTWTQVGSTSISMASNVRIGMAVTSHNDGVLCTATFTNVSASP